MSQKDKEKKGQAESTNKTRLLLRLQKFEAFTPDTAKSFKELGLCDFKKYERHIELMQSDGIIRTEGTSDKMKIWVNRDKIKPKKKSNNSQFLIIWFISTFVLLMILILIFQGGL